MSTKTPDRNLALKSQKLSPASVRAAPMKKDSEVDSRREDEYKRRGCKTIQLGDNILLFNSYIIFRSYNIILKLILKN